MEPRDRALDKLTARLGRPPSRTGVLASLDHVDLERSLPVFGLHGRRRES